MKPLNPDVISMMLYSTANAPACEAKTIRSVSNKFIDRPMREYSHVAGDVTFSWQLTLNVRPPVN